jgi:hypothetical protein
MAKSSTLTILDQSCRIIQVIKVHKKKTFDGTQNVINTKKVNPKKNPTAKASFYQRVAQSNP